MDLGFLSRLCILNIVTLVIYVNNTDKIKQNLTLSDTQGHINLYCFSVNVNDNFFQKSHMYSLQKEYAQYYMQIP